MNLLRTFTIKAMDDVKPGELIRMSLYGSSVAIAMQHSDDGTHLMVMVLRSKHDGAHPYSTSIVKDGYVISYGAGWVLDLGDADGCYPGNYEKIEEPGSVLLTERQTMMRVASDGTNIRHRGGYFDLTEFRGTTRSADVSPIVCIREWAIWASAEERARHGAEPVFSYPG